MPFPNEHSARIEDPGKYKDFRRQSDKFADGIHAIWGIKEDDTTELQAIRFDKEKHSVQESKKWLKDHDIDYISFEPAEEEKGGANMDALEQRSFEVKELRIANNGNGEEPLIVGHAAVFDTLSEELCGFREKISPGAFSNSIKDDDIVALWNHDSNMPLGRNTNGTLTLEEDKVGLLVQITPPETSYGRDAVVAIERGDVNQMSFGFTTIKEAWTTEGEESIRTLVEARLFDVSPVTFPAYPTTDVGVRASLELMGIEQRFVPAIVRATHGLAKPEDFGALEELVAALTPRVSNGQRTSVELLIQQHDLLKQTF